MPKTILTEYFISYQTMVGMEKWHFDNTFNDFTYINFNYNESNYDT
jgi:hypothetical protein